MTESNKTAGIRKITLAGLIVTLGIVYGDIGTSPLYVLKAIIAGGNGISDLLVLGGISCIFWTLTLQTTIKYVLITLRADNHGEGGIFALFALLKKKSTLMVIITMIGGSTLLADGVITPAITVTSAIEGLGIIKPDIQVIPLVLLILTCLFSFQRFGSNVIGKMFGPIMLIWFLMLGILGVSQIVTLPHVLLAINPYYAVKLLIEYPSGILLLGAVFLATTGAEALYSDLGHCGIKNIRISWIFVKTMLVLTYFGQGAWVLNHPSEALSVNPFFAIMPSWFLLPGIIIATAAAVIASQALISGSYTLVSEAISLNFWPKFKVNYPSVIIGQVYIPLVNWFLFAACCFVVVFFGDSSKMEAAYGLSITITMLMTTSLLSAWLADKRFGNVFRFVVLAVYLTIEGVFLAANLNKFMHGGWFTIALALIFFVLMYGWYYGRKIKNRYITFTDLGNYLDHFKVLKNDISIPFISANLVYITKADEPMEVESKIIYSIFRKHPKRANTYFLLHVDNDEAPNTFEYTVNQIIPGTLIKIDFKLGFKIERRINLYFREVIEDMVRRGEFSLQSPFESLRQFDITSNFLFVNLDRVLTVDYKLHGWERFVMNLHNVLRSISSNDVKALGLDTSSTIEEKIPILLPYTEKERIRRRQSND
ncbi:MAG TPA: KUP/HAK/KT family potassium transporter [Bacteroidales bacterium]|nr:KUP/HAK/KT family potassium transporter [Bacteroidales bacterium]